MTRLTARDFKILATSVLILKQYKVPIDENAIIQYLRGTNPLFSIERFKEATRL